MICGCHLLYFYFNISVCPCILHCTKYTCLYMLKYCSCRISQGNSGSIVSSCVLYDRGLIPDGQGVFILSFACIPGLGPTQLLIQWVLWVLSLGMKHSQGVTLTTDAHLVLRFSVSRSRTSTTLKCLHDVAGQLYCNLG
jgi:hypothetical protein